MKRFFISLTIVTSFCAAVAQQKDPIVINPVKHNEGELTSRMYQYPQFTQGKAFYKDGSETNASLNYNYLNNQILFIDAKGDTLQLVNAENFSKIAIGVDTFLYYNKMFVRQVTKNPSYNLFVKRSLEIGAKEKKGAYGTYSGTSSTTQINQISVDRSRPVDLAVDENTTYIFKDYYFVSGRFDKFYPATKKGIYSLFAKNEKDLKEFIEKNETNFNKKEDLEKLLEYMRTIAK